MSSKYLTAAVVVLGLVSLAVGPATVAPPPQDRKAIAAERIELCKKSLQLARKLSSMGTATPDAEAIWSHRLIDSLQSAGLPREELLAAIREHVEVMKAYEADLKNRFSAGLVDQFGVNSGTYARLEAEALLAEYERAN